MLLQTVVIVFRFVVICRKHRLFVLLNRAGIVAPEVSIPFVYDCYFLFLWGK